MLTRQKLEAAWALLGKRFGTYLIVSYLCLKGFSLAVMSVSILPYFKTHNPVQGLAYQGYATAALSPWAAKSFIGALSDLVPLWGYHKRYYIVIALGMGIIASCLLAIGVAVTATQAVILFMMVHLSLSVCDVLAEGAYASVAGHREERGTVVSIVYGSFILGGIPGTILAGLVSPSDVHASGSGFGGLFIVVALLQLGVMAMTLHDYLPESSTTLRTLRRNVRLNLKLYILAFVMPIGVIGVSAASITLAADAPLALMCLCLVFAVMLIGMAQWVFNRDNMDCFIALFVSSILYFHIDGALSWFYTGDAACNPDGPQFSYHYFVSWSGVMQSVCGVLGVIAYNLLKARIHLRNMFFVSCGLRVMAACVDLVIVKRFNIAIGLSDKAAYMLGNNIVASVVASIDAMTAVELVMIVSGGEDRAHSVSSTLYALLASYQNLGVGIARAVGGYLITVFDVHLPAEGQGKSCNFARLPWLILCVHIVPPVLAGVFMYYILPSRERLDIMKGGPQEAAPMPLPHGSDDETEAATEEADGEGMHAGWQVPFEADSGDEVPLMDETVM